MDEWKIVGIRESVSKHSYIFAAYFFWFTKKINKWRHWRHSDGEDFNDVAKKNELQKVVQTINEARTVISISEEFVHRVDTDSVSQSLIQGKHYGRTRSTMEIVNHFRWIAST